MQTNIGLTTETRDKLAQILNTVLADEHVLYTKLRNYHWNVTGWDFISLHALLDEQYDQVKVLADDVAERVRMIGFHPTGTLKAFLDATRLDEAPGSELDARAMVRDLLETNEAMVRNLRADVEETLETFGDEGTGDLLIEAMRMHEEMAWMLRSLLE